MEKIFDAKLDPDIDSPSHETHFDTLPCTCFFGSELWKFSSSVVYGNACSNLSYSNVVTASVARLSMPLECNAFCQDVRKHLQNTFTFRIVKSLKTRQSMRVEFWCLYIGLAASLLRAAGRQIAGSGIRRAT